MGWTDGIHSNLLSQVKWGQKMSIEFGQILVIDKFDKFKFNKRE